MSPAVACRNVAPTAEFPATGALPQHVTPGYDLKTLYVDNDQGNSLTPINPRTGLPGRPIPVADPYNLYFTPDGRYAIDYDYCKGCGLCVAECPCGSIEMRPELA